MTTFELFDHSLKEIYFRLHAFEQLKILILRAGLHNQHLNLDICCHMIDSDYSTRLILIRDPSQWQMIQPIVSL